MPKKSKDPEEKKDILVQIVKKIANTDPYRALSLGMSGFGEFNQFETFFYFRCYSCVIKQVAENNVKFALVMIDQVQGGMLKIPYDLIATKLVNIDFQRAIDMAKEIKECASKIHTLVSISKEVYDEKLSKKAMKMAYYEACCIKDPLEKSRLLGRFDWHSIGLSETISKEILATAKTIDDPVEKCQMLLDAAKVVLKSNQKSANGIIEEIVKHAANIVDNSQKVDCLFQNIAWDLAEINLGLAFEITDRIEKESKKHVTLYILFRNHSHLNPELAINAVSKIKDLERKEKAFTRIIFNLIDNNHIELAINLAHQLKFQKSQISAFHYISVGLTTKNPVQSRQFFEDAIELATNTTDLGTRCNDLCDLIPNMQQVDSIRALQFRQEAINLAKKLEDPFAQVNTLLRLADILKPNRPKNSNHI